MTQEIDKDLVEKAEKVFGKWYPNKFYEHDVLMEKFVQALREVRDEGDREVNEEFLRAEANIVNKKWFQEQIQKERSLSDRLVEALSQIVYWTPEWSKSDIRRVAKETIEIYRKAREGG